MNGSDFLKLVATQEAGCEEQTAKALSTLMGVKAPKCYQDLGDVLLLLDQLASCYWSCSEGDHVVEYATGRAASLARASIKLAQTGYYDESLATTRNLAELTNLLALF